MRIVTAGLVGLSLLALPTTLGAVEPSLVAAVQERLDALAAEMGFPGATLAVVLADGDSFAIATGLGDVVGEIPMTPDDRLMSGSIGKSFVAALALRLAETGRLELDRPVFTWMGAVEGFDRVPNARAFTLRMLLNQTAGVPEWIDKDVRALLQAEPTRVWSRADRLAALDGAEPLFEAGTGFHYTDANYIVAGLAIETGAGNSYESLVRSMLKELQLDSTEPSDRLELAGLVPGYSFALGSYGLEELAPEVALGERTARQVATDQTLVLNPQIEWTGGGLVTTASDLARWVHLLFAGEVMSRAALEQMTADPRSLGYPGYEYAMGLEVWRSDSLGTAYGHSGFFPGYMSDTLHFPDHGFSIAVQINCDHPEIAATRRVLEAIGELLAG